MCVINLVPQKNSTWKILWLLNPGDSESLMWLAVANFSKGLLRCSIEWELVIISATGRVAAKVMVHFSAGAFGGDGGEV